MPEQPIIESIAAIVNKYPNSDIGDRTKKKLIKELVSLFAASGVSEPKQGRTVTEDIPCPSSTTVNLKPYCLSSCGYCQGRATITIIKEPSKPLDKVEYGPHVGELHCLKSCHFGMSLCANCMEKERLKRIPATERLAKENGQ